MTDPRPPVPASDEAPLRELAHVLGHRLRGLVSGIEGYAELLTDALATREQREYALRIVEGTTRIERVLAELHLFSRPVAPERAPLTADETIRGALAMLEPADGARVEVSGPIARAFSADPLLVRQALLILLQNALEATDGPVGLLVAEADGGAGGGAGVRFAVRNEGRIGDDVAARVFVPFYTTKAQNLGVGLAIARRIAVAHGGTLTLAARGGRDGVCFALDLPADERADGGTDGGADGGTGEGPYGVAPAAAEAGGRAA